MYIFLILLKTIIIKQNWLQIWCILNGNFDHEFFQLPLLALGHFYRSYLGLLYFQQTVATRTLSVWDYTFASLSLSFFRFMSSVSKYLSAGLYKRDTLTWLILHIWQISSNILKHVLLLCYLIKVTLTIERAGKDKALKSSVTEGERKKVYIGWS